MSDISDVVNVELEIAAMLQMGRMMNGSIKSDFPDERFRCRNIYVPDARFITIIPTFAALDTAIENFAL
jgi:hypothetical protein